MPVGERFRWKNGTIRNDMQGFATVAASKFGLVASSVDECKNETDGRALGS